MISINALCYSFLQVEAVVSCNFVFLLHRPASFNFTLPSSSSGIHRSIALAAVRVRSEALIEKPTMTDSEFKIVCEEVPLGTVARLTPGIDQKVIFFIRHGQATHNCTLRKGEQYGMQMIYIYIYVSFFEYNMIHKSFANVFVFAVFVQQCLQWEK